MGLSDPDFFPRLFSILDFSFQLYFPDTPLGRILLNGIKFDVGTGLKGLQGLNHYATIINDVDALGGTSDAISLVVATTVINPSNINITTGDAFFLL